MGQIDLFEPDLTDKVVSEILDDKALSEILEVPDDQTLSEILEIPDFTEGDNKADNGSDVSELDCKVVETKDPVRSYTQCGIGHEDEFVECDQGLAAHVQSGKRGSLDDGSLDCTGLVAFSPKVAEDCTGFDADKAMVAHLSGSTAQTFQKDLQPCHSMTNTLDKSEAINESNEAAKDDSLALKIDIGNVGPKTSEVKSDESYSTNLLSMGSGPGLASRCLSPKVDISIPSRVKSNSLASRGIKKPDCVPFMHEVNETLNISASQNQLGANKAQIKTQSENRTVVSAPDHTSIRQTAHLGSDLNECQSAVSSNFGKSSLQTAEKDLKAKAAVGLKDKDKFVATGSSQGLKYHPQSSSFSSFKKGIPDSSQGKRSISRIYRNIPNKTYDPRHASVNVDTETGAKGKQQQAMNDDLASRMKPTYV